MPACKATLDAAKNVEYSSLVVAMCRNGTDLVFGLPEQVMNGLLRLR